MRASAHIFSGLALGVIVACALGCEAEHRFARAVKIETMAQTIGGPAAVARPGDLLLENDKVRAVIHGRRDMRSVAPLANGSLVDLDIQRPHHLAGVGKGKDAFYELGPLVNFKISAGTTIAYGACDAVGDAPCPQDNAACARVSVGGVSDDVVGLIGLFDLVIRREIDGKKTFDPEKLRIITDYDLCPGEAFVRVATTLRFDAEDDGEEPEPVEMEELQSQIGLVEGLLGEYTGTDCAQQPCPVGQTCDELLLGVSLGTLNAEMKRCRTPDQRVAGLLAGDLTLFSAKVRVFLTGTGFDYESYSRAQFDTGGDPFSAPQSVRAMVAVGDGVSYAYFNQGGQLMVPVFYESFTAATRSAFTFLSAINLPFFKGLIFASLAPHTSSRREARAIIQMYLFIIDSLPRFRN